MEIIKALILGIVQGLTEFLPVSSTAHLVIIPKIFGWEGELNSLSFDVALHAGTLLALFVFFWRDWMDLIFKNRRMLVLLGAATIPAGLAGVFLHHYIEETFRSPVVIAVSLTAFGALMLMADRTNTRMAREGRELKGLPAAADALLIGLAQAVALIPGVSRSGITITAGLFRGLTREAAARFSFLLSTPVIGGAVLLEGKKILKAGGGDFHPVLFITGMFAAFVSGYFALKFLLAFIKKYPLDAFVYYRFIVAVLILLFA